MFEWRMRIVVCVEGVLESLEAERLREAYEPVTADHCGKLQPILGPKQIRLKFCKCSFCLACTKYIMYTLFIWTIFRALLKVV